MCPLQPYPVQQMLFAPSTIKSEYNASMCILQEMHGNMQQVAAMPEVCLKGFDTATSIPGKVARNHVISCAIVVHMEMVRPCSAGCQIMNRF